jgi:hypothetical protein
MRCRKDNTWIISKRKQNICSLAVSYPLSARPSGTDRAEADKQFNLNTFIAYITKNTFHYSHSEDEICVCCLGK